MTPLAAPPGPGEGTLLRSGRPLPCSPHSQTGPRPSPSSCACVVGPSRRPVSGGPATRSGLRTSLGVRWPRRRRDPSPGDPRARPRQPAGSRTGGEHPHPYPGPDLTPHSAPPSPTPARGGAVLPWGPAAARGVPRPVPCAACPSVSPEGAVAVSPESPEQHRLRAHRGRPAGAGSVRGWPAEARDRARRPRGSSLRRRDGGGRGESTGRPCAGAGSGFRPCPETLCEPWFPGSTATAQEWAFEKGPLTRREPAPCPEMSPLPAV